MADHLIGEAQAQIGEQADVQIRHVQLLRAIEDQLMKSATHDLIVRAKPDVAIYVLNHKRGHLRLLEEQFGAGIMIQADTSLSGQQYFVIDRGGIARPRPVVAVPRISPDSVAVEYEVLPAVTDVRQATSVLPSSVSMTKAATATPVL